MKIGALGFYPNTNYNLSFQKRANDKNSANVAQGSFAPDFKSLYSSPFTKDSFAATSNISFKGIECSPGNFRIKLAYGVDCPCCGQVMLTKKQSNAFVSRIGDKTGPDLQKELEKEYIYFRKNEREVADLLIDASKENPDLDLSGLSQVLAKDSIVRLVGAQKGIIEQIRKSGEKLSAKRREELEGILSSEAELIDESDDFKYFKRKNFIDKINTFANSCPPREFETANEILSLARTMPTSATSKDAFFVKYQRRTNKDIARRLVLPAMATTEHIRPQSKNGKDRTDNYIPLCSQCNSDRSNTPYNEWFEIHPEMPENLQEYIYQISDMIQNKQFYGWEFYDTYVDDVIQAVYKETNGKLKLKKPEETEAEEGKPIVLPVKEKTIEEMRATWMATYEGLSERLVALRKLKDELYADPEFLNILAYLEKQNQLETSKKNKKALLVAYNNASALYKRAQRELKQAKSEGDSIAKIREFQARVQNYSDVYNAARANYTDAVSRYNAILAERDTLKEIVTTPEEVMAKIQRLKQQKAESEQRSSADQSLSEAQRSEEITRLQNLSASIEKQIAEKEAANKKRESVYDFDSPASKKAAADYEQLKEKQSMIASIDHDSFVKLFKTGGEFSISPDFILEEARDAIQKRMNILLKNPIVQYFKTKEDIEELKYRKREIDSELLKLSSEANYDERIEALYRRKAELQRKFSNVNIVETIDRLQAEADENLQKFTDSFENFGGYQHSNPRHGKASSSS